MWPTAGRLFSKLFLVQGLLACRTSPHHPPPLAVMRLRWAAQNGAAWPLARGSRSQLQATRHGGGTASAPRAGAIPQPAHHHSPSSSGSPSPAPPNRGSSQHLTPTEACPFSRAQPERGARRDPEEKCITILLVLHSSFPHSAWCSTAIPQIKINKINVLLK